MRAPGQYITVAVSETPCRNNGGLAPRAPALTDTDTPRVTYSGKGNPQTHKRKGKPEPWRPGPLHVGNDAAEVHCKQTRTRDWRTVVRRRRDHRRDERRAGHGRKVQHTDPAYGMSATDHAPNRADDDRFTDEPPAMTSDVERSEPTTHETSMHADGPALDNIKDGRGSWRAAL